MLHQLEILYHSLQLGKVSNSSCIDALVAALLCSSAVLELLLLKIGLVVVSYSIRFSS